MPFNKNCSFPLFLGYLFPSSVFVVVSILSLSSASPLERDHLGEQRRERLPPLLMGSQRPSPPSPPLSWNASVAAASRDLPSSFFFVLIRQTFGGLEILAAFLEVRSALDILFSEVPIDDALISLALP